MEEVRQTPGHLDSLFDVVGLAFVGMPYDDFCSDDFYRTSLPRWGYPHTKGFFAWLLMRLKDHPSGSNRWLRDTMGDMGKLLYDAKLAGTKQNSVVCITCKAIGILLYVYKTYGDTRGRALPIADGISTSNDVGDKCESTYIVETRQFLYQR